MAECNPNTLLETARCFQCLSEKELKMIVAQLLCEIEAGSGPVSPCANLEGPEADPTGIYTPEFIGQVYVTSGHVWQATGLTSVDWTEICTDCAAGILTFETVHLNEFDYGGADTDTELHFPNLTQVEQGDPPSTYFNVLDTDISQIDCPLLNLIDGTVTISNNLSLGAVTFPSLVTIGDILTLQDNTNLISITLASLTTIVSSVGITGNTSMTSFSAPVWAPTDGTTVDFTNNALLAASVNHILARCLSVAPTTMNIDLSGGTNAAPTGQGIVDKAALILLGNTVVTN